MPSVWIVTRPTRDGGSRFRVEYRVAGRESKISYGGSFKSRREAVARKTHIAAELLSLRVPKLTIEEPTTGPTFEQAATRWHAARVDVAASTRDQHRIQLAKLTPIIGTRQLETLTAHDFIEVVARLHAAGVARETIRKTLGAGAMALDHAGVTPNPARDRAIKLPREEPEEINPPSAEHLEAVFRLLPSKHRLPLLWLDWSGARVSAIDLTLVGDYDEPRRRVRLRANATKTRKALWIEAHPVLAEAIEHRLGPREDRDLDARLFSGSGADALRTSIAKACKAAGIPLFSPHDLRHRRISLMHLRGVPWARIAEFVGQRDLTVTANTYTHVMIDETELEYANMLG